MLLSSDKLISCQICLLSINVDTGHTLYSFRAETLFSGTLIYPNEDDPNSTKLILVVQDDLKGHVPKFILNFFYGRAPIDWHHNLSTYYHNVYVKQKGVMRDNLIQIR